jgi:hypothetical protein
MLFITEPHCRRSPHEHLPLTTRELAQRTSGTDEILLLWHPENDRVEISIRDLATGAGFQVEVTPGCAIDAFYHPYAYAASSEHSSDALRSPATIDNV